MSCNKMTGTGTVQLCNEGRHVFHFLTQEL